MTDIQAISVAALGIAFLMLILGLRYLEYLEEKLKSEGKKK